MFLSAAQAKRAEHRTNEVCQDWLGPLIELHNRSDDSRSRAFRHRPTDFASWAPRIVPAETLSPRVATTDARDSGPRLLAITTSPRAPGSAGGPRHRLPETPCADDPHEVVLIHLTPTSSRRRRVTPGAFIIVRVEEGGTRPWPGRVRIAQPLHRGRRPGDDRGRGR